MPIIIDDQNNIEQQIDNINKTIQDANLVDSKFFSENYTGSDKRQNGLFGSKDNTLDDFQKNVRRLIPTNGCPPNYVQDKMSMYYNAEMFSTRIKTETKPKEKHFKHFETNLTTMVPPILFYELLDAEPIALTIPKYTGAYNLNAMDSNWTIIANGKIDNKPATTYARTIIQTINLYAKEDVSGTSATDLKKKTKTAGVIDAYIIFATILDDMDKHGDMIFMNHCVAQPKIVDQTQGIMSIVPLFERDHMSYDYEKINQHLKKHNNILINNKKNTIPDIDDYQLKLLIGDQSITDILSTQAVTMNHQLDETLKTMLKTLCQRYYELNQKQKTTDTIKHKFDLALIAYVQHIDILNNIKEVIISTSLLSEFFETLDQTLKDSKKVNDIARHSLRLLLSQRLHELNDLCKNNQLYKFEPKDKNCTQKMKTSTSYSTQQKNIIGSTHPLLIGQAGAGSGKSHTLIGRINYLKEQGEDLNKALVLSFTNVAAINIHHRFPDIRSETLANMFHTIYTNTYPTQCLSQPSTVANALRLLAPSSQYFAQQGFSSYELSEFISKFANRLEQFDQTGFKRVDLQEELKQTANLIENNLEMTITLLNAIEQTTLELEPIIIHHKLMNDHNSLNIPAEYQNLNFIMTDESQDISTFEYILLLELTLHHKSQLLIIGDGSQTLYEFRNSDPRYMNALEASNVFNSHKLEINYRSDQEILTYANQFLQIIEANKYANIQLQSSNFKQPTIQSVKDKIIIENNALVGKISNKNYNEQLSRFFNESKKFEEWFIDRVQKGQQVALMGWTRAEVLEAGTCIEAILQKHQLGHIEITNIMSKNIRPMTILSRFAREKQEAIRRLNPIHTGYMDEIENLADEFIKESFSNCSMPQYHFYCDTIVKNVKDVVTGYLWKAMLADYRNNVLNKYQVGSRLLQELLRIETRKNAMDQYLKKQKDIPDYSKCPIIISTIHGTKGLEFDHTVVLFNEARSGSTSQESLRMLFVALSRAKKSEFIINSHRESQQKITNNQSDMFKTPIGTAFLKTLDDITNINNSNNNII